MMQISAVLPDVLALLPSAGGCRQPEGKHSAHLFDAKCFLSPGLASRKVSSQLSPFNVFLSIKFLDTFVLASIAMESLFFVFEIRKKAWKFLNFPTIWGELIYMAACGSKLSLVLGLCQFELIRFDVDYEGLDLCTAISHLIVAPPPFFVRLGFIFFCVVACEAG